MGNSQEIGVTSIDRFQIREILGEGGQGIVYLAHDPHLNRQVAIKTLTATDGDEMQILLQEARAVSALRHPCIVPVFEAGDYYGTPYLVFEYVTGETLQALIRRAGAMPADQVLRIAAQVLDGLAHAHAQGVLHRDIKPANIMLASDGTPRIMDFGAASRQHNNWLNGSHVGVDVDLIGTPAYMAPEYIEKKQYSAKTDIFAAGLVVCEMLTGTRVFNGGGNVERLFDMIVNDPIVLPPGPGLNEKLVACLHRALAKDPETRFDSVIEFKDALQKSADADSAKPAAADSAGTLDFLLRRIKLKKEFPAMSTSVSKVNGIIFSDTGSVASLTNAVLKDFALTNKIIKLANSSYYNPSGRSNIATISAAIYRLGFDTIRNIVLGLLLFDHMKDRNQARDLMGECMQAILGGAIAKEICVSQGYGNPEETFICAMMHNLGRMLSVYYFPEETAEIRKIVALGDASEEQVSKRVLGASYTELGQGVAKTWGFPAKIIGSMDKTPPPRRNGRARPGPDEATHLLACMASDLSRAVLDCPPEEQKKRTSETMEKYKDRLKLNAKTADAGFGSSLEKFREYTVAVGWTLDRTTSERIGALRQASAETAEEQTVRAAPETLSQSGDFEKTVRVEMHTVAAAPATAAPERARANRDVLAGGIQDITNAMVEGSNLNDILRIIIETFYAGIGFDHVIFALRDPKRAQMTGRFGLGEGIDGLVEQFSFCTDFTPDVFHVALQKNLDVFITDSSDPKIAMRIPAWYRNAFCAGAFVLFPIVINKKPFGLIYADAANANSITIREDEIKLLRTLRNQAVLAVRQLS